MFATTSQKIRTSPQSLPLNLQESLWTSIEDEVQSILENDEKFPKKWRNGNFFKKPSAELRQVLELLLSSFEETHNLVWHFEVFQSVNPVGLHNDRNLFLERDELCEMGMIIPLKTVGQPHLTRFYDLFIPEKVNWDGEGHFRTLDKEIRPHDPTQMNHYCDQDWSKGNIVFFDACQVHEAVFPKEEGCYKLSLNGLGYSQFSKGSV